MAKYTISVDAGNGIVNAVRHMKSGNTQFSEPSVRAAATGDSLGLGRGYELEYPYADFEGHRYITGDHAVRVATKNLQRHLGANRYGNPFHQMLVANAVANLGVKSGKVDLTLFAPPGMYTAAVEQIRRGFLHEGIDDVPDKQRGMVEITLKGDDKARRWKYDSVKVWPEGVAAIGCFALDKNGKLVNGDVLAGDVLVIDVGAYTLDAILLVNGELNPENLDVATWQNLGVDEYIRQPILRELRKASRDMTPVQVEHVDYVIRHGSVSGDYDLTSGAKTINIQPALNTFSERYAQVLADNVIDSAFNGLEGVKSCVVVGGGASLIEDHLRAWYPGKILDRKAHAQTAKLHPGDMNAIGGLRLSLATKGK